MMSAEMLVRFWGVRGGIPCPGADTVVYGGNTSCVELRCGERTIIFDAGSGIRKLGRHLLAEGRRLDLDLIISHCHVDHLIGLPFFAPVFLTDAAIRLWTGHRDSRECLHDAVAQLMKPPLFPITPETFAANLAYRDFMAGDAMDMGHGITLSTAALNHPGGATGYRVDFDGRSFGYFTDHEHGPDGSDPAVVALARGLDLLVLDASYTPEEYDVCRGWGHSTWSEAAALADAAGVRQLALFHHDPSHDDATMARIEADARLRRPATFVAREDQVVTLERAVIPPA